MNELKRQKIKSLVEQLYTEPIINPQHTVRTFIRCMLTAIALLGSGVALTLLLMD